MATSSAKVEHVKDADFYFEDGNLLLSVENVLFKVHQSHFVHSESSVFSLMRTLPQSKDASAEGAGDTSRDQPLHIPGVPAADFRMLLRVLYHPPLASWDQVSDQTQVTAFQLGDRFGLENVTTLIKRLWVEASRTVLSQDSAMQRFAIMTRHQDHFSPTDIANMFSLICRNVKTPNAAGLRLVDPIYIEHMMKGRERLLMSTKRLHKSYPQCGQVLTILLAEHGWNAFLDRICPGLDWSDAIRTMPHACPGSV